MNLSVLIQEKKFEMILLESFIYNDLSIRSKIIKPRELGSIEKEDIPYIKNMLTINDYVLYKLRKGVDDVDKANGETVVRLFELPSSVRDEIHQEAPNTRDSDIFFLSYYGK